MTVPPPSSVIGFGSAPVVGHGSVSVIGQGSGQITPPSDEPETTSIGLTVSRTFTINESRLDDEVIQYEPLDEAARSYCRA